MNQFEEQKKQNKEFGGSNVHFLNAMLISINKSRLVHAVLESFNIKRITLRSSVDKLSMFMSMRGEKQIKAYLISEAGQILIVESIGEPTFNLGKGSNSGYIFLSFNLQKVQDTNLGNVFDKKNNNRIIELLREGISKLKEEGNFIRVEAIFPFRDITLGIQIILEHNSSLNDILGGETIYQHSKQDWGDLNSLEQEGMSRTQVPTKAPLPVGSVIHKSVEPKEDLIRSQKAPVPEPHSLDISEKKKVKSPFSKQPDDSPALTPTEAMRKKLDTYAKSRSDEIKAVAATMSWSESSVEKVMVGDGNYPDTKFGISYSKGNHRDNYRVYFDDFPAMILKDGEPKYARIINISETGAGIGMVQDPKNPQPFLTMGDEIQLMFSLVNLTNLEIRGRVIRDRLTKDETGKAYYYYGVHFHWPRMGAPAHFVESIRKTELFLMAQKGG
ncbi:MAG: PilZ domain-containing protein [Magnetococcus sp. DMHC-6]